jgi:hypothetical protein
VEYPAGWSCERTTRELEHYLASTLALRESLAIAEHLEACVGCAQRLVLYRLTLARRTRG